jgi:hypothetical protein
MQTRQMPHCESQRVYSARYLTLTETD